MTQEEWCKKYPEDCTEKEPSVVPEGTGSVVEEVPRFFTTNFMITGILFLLGLCGLSYLAWKQYFQEEDE